MCFICVHMCLCLFVWLSVSKCVFVCVYVFHMCPYVSKSVFMCVFVCVYV